MIRSMTGFGRSEVSNELNQTIVVEVKSVNHRYCDVTLKNPRKFTMFEPKIRNLFKEYANRGKVDLAISYEDMSENTVKLHYNREMAKEYMDAFKAMEEDFGVSALVTARELSQCSEVLTLQEQSMDEDRWWGLIEQAVKEAGKQFVSSREVEGERLREDLIQKLHQMKEDVAFVESRSPQIVEEYRLKLEEKVKDLLETAGIDENRIAAEVTLYADKISVDEEIVRLQSHIAEMENILNQDDSVGRKLDFMAQEMNREANTILSKSNDVELSNHAIELKTNVEKIREQVQNIE
ncbi:MAG: YicC family protein [Anaerostipes sp.]|nr:YicC family protein [Anaerostipes sp.]